MTKSPVSTQLGIVLAASEAVPYAKTGGLADVVGALALELSNLGHRVTLIVPDYRKPIAGRSRRFVTQIALPTVEHTGIVTVEEEVLDVASEERSLRVWFVRYDPYFDRPGLYQHNHHDYPDNLERFILFCRAVLEALRVLIIVHSETVDVLHVHDWQTSLCPVYLKTLQAEYQELQGVKSLLTLHNVGYQGLFPGEQFVKTGLPASVFSPSGIEFYGSVNCLKGGIIYSDAVSTVSPTYAKEIMMAEYGCGLEGVLANRSDGIHGITNGVDINVWSPERDPYLPASYSAMDLSGKLVCKRELQRELGLPNHDFPILAVVGRLTAQKGFDLLMEIVPELMALDLQLAILGVGDSAIEQDLRAARQQYSDRMGLHIGFDEGLAHRFVAGADMLLMPSRYEPCGLTQLYGLRYGTVPIVRYTGGLADTVVSFKPSTAQAKRTTGFHFVEASPYSLLVAVMLSLRVYKERETWSSLILAGMQEDISWNRSAQRYIDLYNQMRLGKPRSS